MTALVRQPIDEMAFFDVSEAIARLPGDWRDGMLWWLTVQATQAGSQHQRSVLLGPPRDLGYLVTRDPAELFAVALRHPCAECEDSLREGQRWMAEHPGQWVCLAQFTQDYLQDARQAAAHPLPVGRLVTAASITCPLCGATSWNPNDVREGYCGRCHAFTRQYAGARAPRCPGCDQVPTMIVGSQAFCGDDDCRAFSWDLFGDPARFKAEAKVLDLSFIEQRSSPEDAP